MTDIESTAAEVMATVRSGRSIAPFSGRLGGLSLADAYRVTARLDQARRARGERPVGRKIGFTNRTIWAEYGVYAPIWGYVTERTLHRLEDCQELALNEFSEPRIEPEIVFGLSAAPLPTMDEAALMQCIGWVAHGFEIVQSIFPDWRFSPADTVAANGLHGALLVGPRHPIGQDAPEWLARLATFEIELLRNGSVADRGRAANVLDSPVSALRHLVGLLAEDDVNPPLQAGEIVTTGTLTRALPVAPGERWSTRLHGIVLGGIEVRFV